MWSVLNEECHKDRKNLAGRITLHLSSFVLSLELECTFHRLVLSDP